MLTWFLIFIQCPNFTGTQSGTVQEPSLNEISGIAASRKNPGVLWVHNDSGGLAAVYALNSQGDLLATVHLSEVTVTDVEDITMGTNPSSGNRVILLGDIGDNNAIRTYVTIYRISEPVVYPCLNDSETPVFNLTPEIFHLTYPDGPRDAETLLFDPVDRNLYIVSKRDFPVGRLYQVPSPLLPGQTVELEYILDIDMAFPVGGDVSADGSAIILKNYFQPLNDNAMVWRRMPGTDFTTAFNSDSCRVTLIDEPQGEAIAFDPFSSSYFTTSEGVGQPVYEFQSDDFWMEPLLPVYCGDFNRDLYIDQSDLRAMNTYWKMNCQTNEACREMDLSDDHRIDLLDYVRHTNLQLQAQCLID
jgi:hypothetical protein